MRRFAFPPQARLHSSGEFQRVYRRGKGYRIYPLRFRVLRRGTPRSRLGLAVSRKVGGAVLRNRWKRRIREAFRLKRHRLRAGYDIVASVDWEARPGEEQKVQAAFDKLIEQLNAEEAG